MVIISNANKEVIKTVLASNSINGCETDAASCGIGN